MTVVEFITALLVTLTLIIASFVAGLLLSGYYCRKAESEKEYALKKQFARIKACSDADDHAGPYVSRSKIQLPPEFEDRLRENGQATASFSNS